MNHICQVCFKPFYSTDSNNRMCGLCQSEAIELANLLRRAVEERDHTEIFNATQQPETNPAAN